MTDLIFSCMTRADVLCLDDFQSSYHVQVNTQNFTWETAWNELLRIALYGQGPDVSEIGNTWLSSLVAMEALRPLTPRELGFLGGQAHFVPAAWGGSAGLGEDKIWTVPWLIDTRVIYYRRDWLEQAGIKETSAFETHEAMIGTLGRLQASKIEIPWAMPTRSSLDMLLNMTSWVWKAGGHFRTPDGRRLRLGEPEAQAGMRAYFELHHFLAPPAQALNVVETDLLFSQGKAAAVISGPWLLRTLMQAGTLLPDVGVALVPGVPYVGGTDLVIWRHALNVHNAIQFIAHLTSPKTQRHIFNLTGFLPSCAAVLDDEPFTSDPYYRVFAQSLKSGRMLQRSRRWAVIEQRLVNMLSQLWSDLASNPCLDLGVEIAERTAVLINRLEKIIVAN